MKKFACSRGLRGRSFLVSTFNPSYQITNNSLAAWGPQARKKLNTKHNDRQYSSFALRFARGALMTEQVRRARSDDGRLVLGLTGDARLVSALSARASRLSTYNVRVRVRVD